jgi:cation:H+ antiporter
MLANLLLIAAGCVLLYFGADWLVRGASTIADALGAPKAVIGLTLVAFGTSAPEMFVNLLAGYQGETGFALSNVSGSNLTNICVGFGLCGLLGGVAIKWSTFRADFVVLVLSAGMIAGFLLIFRADPRLPFWTTVPLLGVLTIYLISLGRRGVAGPERVPPAETSAASLWLQVGLVLLGVAALYGGGKLVLASAISIAQRFHVDPALIGLTIVAAGTSVPDTIASVIAARRQEHEIAVGNLLGSNISNVLVVLSGTLLASRLGGKPAASPGVLLASGDILVDYVMVCVVSLALIAVAATMQRVRRPAGIALLVFYFGYMTYRVIVELVLHSTA